MIGRAGSAARPVLKPVPTAPEALQCPACKEALGSAVAFCPFCGAKQGAASPASRPPAAAPAPPVAAKPVGEQPAVAAAATAPTSRTDRAEPPPLPTAKAEAQPPPAAPWGVVTPPSQSPRPPPSRGRAAPPRRRPGGGLRGFLGVVGAAFLAIVGLWVALTPVPKATLTVRVHGPGGALLTTGHVLVNGREVGVPGQSISVPAGAATVAFEQPGWTSAPRSLTLADGAVATVDLNAAQAPARVAVSSNPPGATVRIGGRSYGQTPLTVDLPPGSYEVALTLAGYTAKTFSVILTRGDARQIGVDLSPAQPAPAPVRLEAPSFERGVVVVPTPLLANPKRGSEAVAALSALAEVRVQALAVAEESWLQLRVGDRTGYVPAVGVVEAWEYWANRNTVSGPFEGVVPHLRVAVAGRTLALAGVQMPEHGYSPAGLARVEAGLGERLRWQQVQCVPATTSAYFCTTEEGRDAGEAMVLVGAAVAGPGAPPYYLESQRVAQGNGRGLWSAP